jgi:hypothetical protein
MVSSVTSSRVVGCGGTARNDHSLRMNRSTSPVISWRTRPGLSAGKQ